MLIRSGSVPERLSQHERGLAQELSAWLSLNPGWLATALFSTAFVESLAIAGIIVPGVAILFAIAALAGQTGMPLTEALIWAGLGAIAGDTASFALGRKLQGRLDVVWPLSRYPILMAKGQAFFASTAARAWSSDALSGLFARSSP